MKTYENRFYKESDLPGHLKNPEQDNNQAGEDSQPDQDGTIGPNELLKQDFQLYEAHTLLRGVTILSPNSGKTSASRSRLEHNEDADTLARSQTAQP